MMKIVPPLFAATTLLLFISSGKTDDIDEDTDVEIEQVIKICVC